VVGVGSYSIYLWQQLFLNPRHEGWIHQFPQNLLLTFGAAFLSYWLIEQPMNRLKGRIAE
jgi:peptidoglycan/LPS O-acetylase OafA/YrhL